MRQTEKQMETKGKRETPVLESLLIKIQAYRFIKKRLQHRSFPVKFVKILTKPFKL